jgi:hypothetical protein
MALLKFNLTENHIKLLKHLKWSLNNDNNIESIDIEDSLTSPFGGDNIYEDINTILNGKPADFTDFLENGIEFTEEEKSDMIKLYKELTKALDIILFTSSFEPGLYSTKWYDRNWKKIINKK